MEGPARGSLLSTVPPLSSLVCLASRSSGLLILLGEMAGGGYDWKVRVSFGVRCVENEICPSASFRKCLYVKDLETMTRPEWWDFGKSFQAREVGGTACSGRFQEVPGWRCTQQGAETGHKKVPFLGSPS